MNAREWNISDRDQPVAPRAVGSPPRFGILTNSATGSPKHDSVSAAVGVPPPCGPGWAGRRRRRRRGVRVGVRPLTGGFLSGVPGRVFLLAWDLTRLPGA